ncbi:uncharacterized protein LOC141692045 [Apium graveolens]|uniref:uncharacterized protein LOC141692045 n=1 Tax=Apium graveolens TaxID=4045 RepID=UPI003D7A6AA7
MIPKKQNPVSMADLRPIALCNVVYKIVSKVLANRLKHILNGVISESQSAFIPGRWIFDNIMISYEVMHYLKRKVAGKTGREVGAVTPSRGIRQGDPHSSYLFLVCMEGLTALIQDHARRKLLTGIKVGRGAPVLTHMFFADDSYVFCTANGDTVEEILNVLQVYEKASGQKINRSKSSVVFSCNTIRDIKESVCNTLGFQEADEGTTYLGLPNMVGRKKNAIFGYIKSQMQERIEGWDKKQLSYWWRASSKKPKSIHWMSWDRLCAKKSEGGTRFRKLHDFNVALLGKQGWRLITNQESMVSRVYKARYYPEGDFLSAKLGSNPRYVWRSVLEAQNLLKAGASKRVGNGLSTDIMKDLCLACDIDHYIHTDHDAIKGQMVSCLMSTTNEDCDDDLVWDNFNERDTSLILSTPIRRSERDIWFWRKERLGHYTVKSAYAVLRDLASGNNIGRNSISLNKLWNQKMPLKVKYFIWRSPARLQLNVGSILVTTTNRNEVVWQQKGRESKDIVASALQVLNNWESAQDRSFDNSFGFIIQTDGDTHWQQSQIGIVKINTDVTLLEESHSYNHAMVARNHEGTLLEAKSSCKHGRIHPELVESIGIREALSWIKTKDWQEVIVESDCLGAIQAIRCSSVNFSYLGRVIDECKKLLVDVESRNVTLKFVKRSANSVALYLAKYSSFIADRTWELVDIHSDFLNVLLKDLNH